MVIKATNIWKRLGRRTVLRGASLDVDDGELVVVVGENGSGKSTLLHVLSGVIEADRGDLDLVGPVGFAPEKPDIPEHLLVAEWIDVIASLKGLRAGAADRLGFGVGELRGTLVRTLSLGQRQRVSLATALMGDPAVLVLDEPTNALDRDSREELFERLAGRTAVIATHDPGALARIGSRTAVVREGVISVL
jgi:ABC-type multidrug transport system ATPase subunit